MAQFDVFRWRNRLLIDCQADTLARMDTRVVIPLVATQDVRAFPRLTPVVRFNDDDYFIAAQLITAVSMRELGQPIGSLAEHRYAILGAIDLLVTGY